jgi:inhibitor of cysteine peptidase
VIWRTVSDVKRVVMLLAVLALTVVAASCGDDDDGSGGGEVYTQSGEAITVAVGEQFTIELAANPSTGYHWQLAQPTGDQVTLVDLDYEPEGEVRPGSSGVQRMVFEGVQAGSTTVSLVYVRPWEPDAPAETAEFPVTVT